MSKLTQCVFLCLLVLVGNAFSADHVLGKYGDFSMWGVDSGAVLEKSVEHKTTGEACVKLIMPKDSQYPGIMLEHKGEYDLKAVTSLVFDVYNAGKVESLVLKIKAEGKSEVSIDLEKIASMLNMEKVKYIKIWTLKPNHDVILYLDNLRLK